MSEQEKPREQPDEGKRIVWTDPIDQEKYDAYEITLPYKGQDERFVVREITLGEEGEYLEAITEVTIAGSTMVPRINVQEVTTQSVYLSLCEAPFDCKPGEEKKVFVKKLKAKIGNALGHYADRLNNFNEIKKAGSNTPSTTEAATDEQTEN